MAKIRVNATVILEIDPLEYAIPADFNIKETLSEDIGDAIESSLSIHVKRVLISKVTKTLEKDDYDEEYYNN